MKERGLFLADIDEGRLDARDDGRYAAEVDVPDRTPAVFPFDEELDELLSSRMAMRTSRDV